MIEPWAAEFAVAPGAVFVIRATSHVPGALEVEKADGCVICWAWPGSTVEVWSEGQLVSSRDHPVPAVPEGMSVRQFLRTVLAPDRHRVE